MKKKKADTPAYLAAIVTDIQVLTLDFLSGKLESVVVTVEAKIGLKLRESYSSFLGGKRRRESEDVSRDKMAVFLWL